MPRNISTASARAQKQANQKLTHGRLKSYKVIFESITSEKKKLRTIIAYEAKPPPGFTFVPAGNPELTLKCKELSRLEGNPIFVVSTAAKNKKNSNLSHQVHRIGYHIRSAVVNGVCNELGLYISRAGIIRKRPQWAYDGLYDAYDLDDVPSDTQGRESPTQLKVNSDAQDVIRDLFPKIPNQDVKQIIRRAFKKGKKKVGTAENLPLTRRAQLAVVAHIRHTYTKYDSILKAGGDWPKARSEVQESCVKKLVEWRGDEENSSYNIGEMEEIIREVIVISDDEEDDDEEYDKYEALDGDAGRGRSPSVIVLSSESYIEDLQEPTDQGGPLDNDRPYMDLTPGHRTYAMDRRTLQTNRRGLHRYRALEEKLAGTNIQDMDQITHVEHSRSGILSTLPQESISMSDYRPQGFQVHHLDPRKFEVVEQRQITTPTHAWLTQQQTHFPDEVVGPEHSVQSPYHRQRKPIYIDDHLPRPNFDVSRRSITMPSHIPTHRARSIHDEQWIPSSSPPRHPEDVPLPSIEQNREETMVMSPTPTTNLSLHHQENIRFQGSMDRNTTREPHAVLDSDDSPKWSTGRPAARSRSSTRAENQNSNEISFESRYEVRKPSPRARWHGEASRRRTLPSPIYIPYSPGHRPRMSDVSHPRTTISSEIEPYPVFYRSQLPRESHPSRWIIVEDRPQVVHPGALRAQPRSQHGLERVDTARGFLAEPFRNGIRVLEEPLEISSTRRTMENTSQMHFPSQEAEHVYTPHPLYKHPMQHMPRREDFQSESGDDRFLVYPATARDTTDPLMQRRPYSAVDPRSEGFPIPRRSPIRVYNREENLVMVDQSPTSPRRPQFRPARFRHARNISNGHIQYRIPPGRPEEVYVIE